MREYDLARGLREEGNVPSALQHLRTSIALDPENAEAFLLLGWIHYERSNYPAAEENLQRGVDLLVRQDRLGSTLAEARNLLGVTLIERGRYDDAIRVLRASALDDMNTAPHLAWGNLGLAQSRKGEREAAIVEWREVKAVFVDSPVEAVHLADRLLASVMKVRGYPMADFDRRYEDMTVDHGEVARHYREGHEITERHRLGQASTEDLRQAMIHFEALFDDLVNEPGHDTPVRPLRSSARTT